MVIKVNNTDAANDLFVKNLYIFLKERSPVLPMKIMNINKGNISIVKIFVFNPIANTIRSQHMFENQMKRGSS